MLLYTRSHNRVMHQWCVQEVSGWAGLAEGSHSFNLHLSVMLVPSRRNPPYNTLTRLRQTVGLQEQDLEREKSAKQNYVENQNLNFDDERQRQSLFVAATRTGSLQDRLQQVPVVTVSALISLTNTRNTSTCSGFAHIVQNFNLSGIILY